MTETFLRGDNLESYLPMGENGQAVHHSALQLRETLRLRQLSEVANSLAIPQGNEQGDRIDWYAGFSGHVVPWAAATDDERQSALRQLEANQAAIEQLSTQMVNQKAHEMRLFGALLSKAIQFPDQDHIYLVDGKPVITFWGFVNAKQQARPKPLDCLLQSHQETFLRSDKLEGPLPMEESGQAAHLFPLRLRESLRSHQLPGVADSLAIPKVNRQGERIDWYAGFSGKVVPWAAATADERQSALQQLKENQSAVEQLSAQLPEQKAHEMRQLAGLLNNTIQSPAQDCIYLVNGKPILTLLGKASADLGKIKTQQKNANTLDSLRPMRSAKSAIVSESPITSGNASKLATEPVASVASLSSSASASMAKRTQRRRLRRWLWLLLPLLLILLSLLLLRGCMPEMPVWGIVSSTHTTPSHQDEVISFHGVTSSGGILERSDTINSNNMGNSQLLNPPLKLEAENSAADGMPSAKDSLLEKSVSESMDSGKSIPSTSTDLSNNSSISGTPTSSSEEMTIPASALQQNNIDFLNGRWHAGAGIQDSRTGKPLSLTYQIHNGKGQVEVVRGDGIRCQAPVRAAMNTEILQLNNSGEAKCTDGSNYTMPDVVCQQGTQNMAECKGRYDEKTLFPMSMKREAN
ncbi:SrfA family protein [Xenorhabdus griffiniae]|uniref:SrfA family protein n=1 Tax=Xenorhabdus griffiniae TaxID=351672 RepID=UPI0030D53533